MRDWPFSKYAWSLKSLGVNFYLRGKVSMRAHGIKHMFQCHIFKWGGSSEFTKAFQMRCMKQICALVSIKDQNDLTFHQVQVYNIISRMMFQRGKFFIFREIWILLSIICPVFLLVAALLITAHRDTIKYGIYPCLFSVLCPGVL